MSEVVFAAARNLITPNALGKEAAKISSVKLPPPSSTSLNVPEESLARALSGGGEAIYRRSDDEYL